MRCDQRNSQKVEALSLQQFVVGQLSSLCGNQSIKILSPLFPSLGGVNFPNFVDCLGCRTEVKDWLAYALDNQDGFGLPHNS